MNTNYRKLAPFIVFVLFFSGFAHGKGHSSKKKKSTAAVVSDRSGSPAALQLERWFNERFGHTPGFAEYGDEWVDAIEANLQFADYEKMLEAITNDVKTPQLYYAFVQKYYRPYFDGLEPAELIKLRSKALTKSTLLKVLNHHAGLSAYLPERKFKDDDILEASAKECEVALTIPLPRETHIIRNSSMWQKIPEDKKREYYPRIFPCVGSALMFLGKNPWTTSEKFAFAVAKNIQRHGNADPVAVEETFEKLSDSIKSDPHVMVAYVGAGAKLIPRIREKAGDKNGEVLAALAEAQEPLRKCDLGGSINGNQKIAKEVFDKNFYCFPLLTPSGYVSGFPPMRIIDDYKQHGKADVDVTKLKNLLIGSYGLLPSRYREDKKLVLEMTGMGIDLNEALPAGLIRDRDFLLKYNKMKSDTQTCWAPKNLLRDPKFTKALVQNSPRCFDIVPGKYIDKDILNVMLRQKKFPHEWYMKIPAPLNTDPRLLDVLVANYSDYKETTLVYSTEAATTYVKANGVAKFHYRMEKLNHKCSAKGGDSEGQSPCYVFENLLNEKKFWDSLIVNLAADKRTCRGATAFFRQYVSFWVNRGENVLKKFPCGSLGLTKEDLEAYAKQPSNDASQSPM